MRPRGELQHEPIALLEPRFRDVQTPEAIPLERVGTGQIDHELSLRSRQRSAYTALYGIEIRLIARAVRQLDVEIGARLAERKVVRRVHGERKYAGIVGQDRCGAVALMHVAIDDCDPLHQPLSLQRAGRDGGIVEYAIPLAMIAERVMRAAREIHADAFSERSAGGAQRGSARAP